LYNNDRVFLDALCLALAGHRDEYVRGNAILGFGHIARRFGRVPHQAIGLIEKALLDESIHVKGQAWAAASDVVQFTGTSVKGYSGSV
jgi:hypothetical protein